LGAALAQQGKLEDARAAMRRSIELHPRHASWYDNLAAIEEAAGDTAAARILRAQAATMRGRTAGVLAKPLAAN
jgi:Flp pilus assembly protein TadD